MICPACKEETTVSKPVASIEMHWEGAELKFPDGQVQSIWGNCECDKCGEFTFSIFIEPNTGFKEVEDYEGKKVKFPTTPTLKE